MNRRVFTCKGSVGIGIATILLVVGATNAESDAFVTSVPAAPCCRAGGDGIQPLWPEGKIPDFQVGQKVLAMGMGQTETKMPYLFERRMRNPHFGRRVRLHV